MYLACSWLSLRTKTKFVTCFLNKRVHNILTGKLLTFLYPDAKGPRKVFAVDLTLPTNNGMFKLFDTAATGGLSLQEQLRRERMRLFTLGIATYEWSCKSSSPAQRLIVPLGGKVLLYERSSSSSADSAQESNECRVIYDGSAGDAVDPHLSPDGNSVAFVINDDLYAMQIPALLAQSTTESQSEEESAAATARNLKRLTYNGAKVGVTCGLADYLAQEEMDR